MNINSFFLNNLHFSVLFPYIFRLVKMRIFLNTSAVHKSKTVIKLIFRYSVKRTNHTMANWQQEKEKLLTIDINEKRTYYKSKKYFGLNDVPTWKQYALDKKLAEPIPILTGNTIDQSKNGILADKISMFKGDITTLEVSYSFLKKMVVYILKMYFRLIAL